MFLLLTDKKILITWQPQYKSPHLQQHAYKRFESHVNNQGITALISSEDHSHGLYGCSKIPEQGVWTGSEFIWLKKDPVVGSYKYNKKLTCPLNGGKSNFIILLLVRVFSRNIVSLNFSITLTCTAKMNSIMTLWILPEVTQILHFSTHRRFQNWNQCMRTVERHNDIVLVTDNCSAELNVKYKVF